MALDKDVFYESRGRVVHPTWPKNFEDHETRLQRAWRRCSGAFGSLERTIRSYLLAEGRIPGPLRSVVMREVLVNASALENGLLDFGLAHRWTVVLDQASTAFTVKLPPLARHEVTHVTLRLEQDAVGGRLATFSDNVIWIGAAPTGSPPTLSPDASTANVLSGYCRGTTQQVEFIASPTSGRGFTL